MKNTNTRQIKLSTRILLFVLVFMMIVTLAITTIYMVIEQLTDDTPETSENGGNDNSTTQNSGDNKNQDLDHEHNEDGDIYY